MSRKQAIVLFTIALVLAIVFVLQIRSERFPEEKSRIFLPEFQANKITKIVLKDSENKVQINLQDNGWTINNRAGYPANFERVRQFLRTMAEVEVIRKPQAGVSQFERLRLHDPEKHKKKSGTVVTLFKQDNIEAASFILGQRHLTKIADGKYTTGGKRPTGAYARSNAETNDVFLLNKPFSSISANPTDWLDKSFLQMGVIKSIKVQFKDSKDNWELKSEDDKGNMKLQGLAENEKSTLGKIKSLVKFFPSPAFTDVVTDKEILQFITYDHKIVITDMDGFHYHFRFGNQIDDTTVCKVKVTLDSSDEKHLEKLNKINIYNKWTYQIPTSLITPFKFKRSELITTAENGEKNIEEKQK